ncbi:MAG: hypothetical protein Q9181_006142 [Wetmoreana brouardii]
MSPTTHSYGSTPQESETPPKLGTKRDNPPFLSLPLEIRRRIYDEVLPQQDADPYGTEWGFWHENIPQIPLLHLNQRIYVEVLQLLTTRNSMTFSVTPTTCDLLDDWMIRGGPAVSLDLPSLSFSDISPLFTNWQIAIDGLLIGFSWREGCLRPFDLSNADRDWGREWRWRNFQKHLKICVEALKQSQKIHTLKVRLPCLCYMGCGSQSLETSDGLRFLFTYLQSLKQIRVNVRCTFLACDTNTNFQCWKRECCDLAVAFFGFKEIIKGKVTALETIEEKWLSIEQRAMRTSTGWRDEVHRSSWFFSQIRQERASYRDNVRKEKNKWKEDFEQLRREAGEPPAWLELEAIDDDPDTSDFDISDTE